MRCGSCRADGPSFIAIHEAFAFDLLFRRLGVLAGTTACAQGGGNKAVASSDTASVREFSRQFLHWYIRLQPKPGTLNWWPVLTAKPPVIDSVLTRALRADSIAWQTDPPTREALDFDPFVGGQDKCPRYVPGDIVAKGSGYRVAARGICGTATKPLPGGVDAFLEVRRIGGRWVISNVLYEGGDLLALLCQRAKAELNPARRPKTCP